MNQIETISNIQQNLWLITAEILLAVTICYFIILGFFKRISNSKIIDTLFVTVLILSIAVNLNQYGFTADLFASTLRKNNFTDALKFLVDFSGILTALLLFQTKDRKTISQQYALLLTIVLGCHLLLMSVDMLLIFISLELISLPSYVLTGIRLQKQSAEATIKYFIYGAVASAAMLYGFSLLYGITGSTSIFSVASTGLQPSSNQVAIFAMMLVLGALLFKVAAAPMHFWAPDVYQAASTPVVAFFSTAPKIAGIGLITVFCLTLQHTTFNWQFMIAFLAIITISVGNFGALAQENVKRLMAYSSIAQSGFLLSAIAVFNIEGMHVLVFFAAVYVAANFLLFHFIGLFEEKEIYSVTDYKGTSRGFLTANICILVGLLSLTGLPPTAGFTSKLLVFTGVWQSFATTDKPILLILLIVGLLNTVVSLFYYLKIPYYAFMKSGTGKEKQNFHTLQNFFGLILVVVILMLFFAPRILMSWINNANFAF